MGQIRKGGETIQISHLEKVRRFSYFEMSFGHCSQEMQDADIVYDLIIAGGGPAGSAAGRQAGKRGLKTLLIEKETFPRYKPCGGAVSERGMSYLDFAVPDHIIERNIYAARVHFRDSVIEKRKEHRLVSMVNRRIFDNYLLEKARETGIEIRMGENVLACEEQSGWVDVCTSAGRYRAKFVIIAEGSQGKLKEQVRGRDRKNESGMCVVTEIEEDDETIDSYVHNVVDIHFGVARMGYGWILPHRGCFSVGIGGLASDLPHPRRTMLEFLNDHGFNGRYRLKGHLIPLGGVKRNTAGSRIALCGDAAGFIDPFCGEGIPYAIRSGQIAGEIISEIVLSDDRPETLHGYELRCEAEFGENLRYSLMVSRLMHRFPGIFLKILATSEEALDKYLEVIVNRRTYKSYLKWLIPRVPKFLLLK